MRGGQWKNGGYCSGVSLDDKIPEDKIFNTENTRILIKL